VCIGKFQLLISFLLIFFTLSWAQPAFKWRIYKISNNCWFASPSGLLVFSSATQTIRPVTIDPVRKISLISDIVEYEGYLFVSTDAGLYKIDITTQGSERVAFPDDKIIMGKISVDMDYIWLADSITLYSYDRLSAEWESYKIPGNDLKITGIHSNGEVIYCIGKTAVNSFSISTEKWNTNSFNGSISDSAFFWVGKNTLNVINANSIQRYIPSSFSWETTTAKSVPRDYLDEDSVIYYVDSTQIMKLSASTNVIRPLDIPQTGEIKAFSKIADTLLIATQKRIIKYVINSESMDFIEYSEDLDASSIEKIFFHDKFLIVVYESFIALYDFTNRSWQKSSLGEFKQKLKAVTWDDKGFVARYAPGYQSSLTGNSEEYFSLRMKGFKYDTTVQVRSVDGRTIRDTTIDSIRIFGYSLPSLPLMNLNLRTTYPHDRNLDITFNNTSLSTVPDKGIYYQGNRDDRLNNIKIGTTSSSQFSSTTLPAAQMEGGSVVIESKKRTAKRDRKVLRIAAGSGLITTKTQWRTLPFRSDGTYYLINKTKSIDDSLDNDEDILDPDIYDISNSDTLNADTTRIVPGSVRVWIDGEPLDSTEYTFYSLTGKLQFSPNAPIDAVSTITIQYKIQTIPDGGINEVELLPEHNFGIMHYGSVTLSPRDWISARVGITGLDSDTIGSSSSLSPIINTSIPIEIRRDKLFMKFNPEYSFNAGTGAKAGAASLQSRFGKKTGLVFNGMFADENYITTDTLSYGYGAIRNQFDFLLSHDFKDEIPLSYYQHRRFAANGIESRFSAQAGAHFSGFPFLDLSLSRSSIEHFSLPDSEKTAFDSLFDTKDKVKIRLYETTSRILEKLTHAKKISYDLSHSEYRYESEGKSWRNGRMSTAEITISPIQPITLSGNLLYQGGIDIDSMPSSILRPRLELQSINAPKGIDLNATYYLNYGTYSSEDSSTDTITRSINVIIKPGMWFPALRWFSTRAAISQDINTAFNVSGPGFWEILTGTNGASTHSLQRSFGFNVFPTEEILLRNNNEFSKIDTSNIFKTTNDIQIWLNSRNFWQAIWNYSSKNEVHNGSITYDRTWAPWLRTSPGMAVNSINDSTGNKLDLTPSLKLNINYQNFWIIKIFSTSHDFKLIWTRHNNKFISTPNIAYSITFSILLRPNIQINNFEIMVFKQSKISDFQSRTSLTMNF
jgi:hypothetical protein